MSENTLPSSWAKTNLQSVADWGSGGTPSRKRPDFYEGRIPWLKTGELGPSVVRETQEKISEEALKNSSAKLFPRGSIALAMYGATIGKASILGIDMATNQACAVGQPIAELIELNFLYTYIFSQKREFTKAGIGGAQPNISQGVIKTWTIPLPPLNEQKRIVAKIEELFSELDAGVASLKQARTQLGTYRQSLLKQAFEGKLTAQWRRDHPDQLESPKKLLTRIQKERETRYQQSLQTWQTAIDDWEASGKEGKRPARPAKAKESKISEDSKMHHKMLPSTWFFTAVGNIGDVQLGRQRSPKNRSDQFPTKYIRAANITESGLKLDDVLDMDFTPSEKRRYQMEYGDIVLSEASGSPDQVGKPAMWKDEIDNCCFQNTVIRQRPGLLEMSSYLLWLYRNYYRNSIFSKTAGGVGINHLSAQKFASLPAPLCSLPEQQEIVRLLEEQFTAIEQNEREIEASLRRAEALRQSILKRAFSGQLVPQDPSDEPATQLLARIQQERSEREKVTPTKKAAKRARKKAQKTS